MKKVLFLSRQQWNDGMEGLNKITYPQKKYHAQTLIERSSPVSNYQYYGRIEERRFYISPVLFGLNRITTVLAGYITESDMGCKATRSGCVLRRIFETPCLSLHFGLFCVFSYLMFIDDTLIEIIDDREPIIKIEPLASEGAP
jgi:hypothetical protein